MCSINIYMFFFFKYTATTEIYTLSPHDALPTTTKKKKKPKKKLTPQKDYKKKKKKHKKKRKKNGKTHVRTPVTVRTRKPSSA